MAIKIHHGPNGSYKTSGAVWDDAVPAARAGRHIITNVRGMSRERFEALFDDLPDSFDVQFISHESTEGMELIRTWFQWAPRNAFLIFDEAQVIFPSKWTDKFVERFDFPGGPDKAKTLDKPTDWLSAWTMHRHFNWDIVLTMPNIKYLHTDIRNTSEAAYQHSNLMLLGKWMKKLVAKDYKEAMHSAQENKAPTDGSNIVTLRKIDTRVFKLYDSTATGLHRDTMAGKNALASPRVLILVGAIALVIGFAFYTTGGHPFRNPLAVPTPQANSAPPVVSRVSDIASDRHLAPPVVSPQQASTPITVEPADPYSLYTISIKGSLESSSQGVMYVFQMFKDDRTFQLTSKEMTAAGYSVYSRGTCAAELVYNSVKRPVTCLGTMADGGGEKRLGAERRVAAVGPSSSSTSSQSAGSNPTQARGQQFVVVSDTSRMQPVSRPLLTEK